jgi:hypothetical protein
VPGYSATLGDVCHFVEVYVSLYNQYTQLNKFSVKVNTYVTPIAPATQRFYFADLSKTV